MVILFFLDAWIRRSFLTGVWIALFLASWKSFSEMFKGGFEFNLLFALRNAWHLCCGVGFAFFGDRLFAFDWLVPLYPSSVHKLVLRPWIYYTKNWDFWFETRPRRGELQQTALEIASVGGQLYWVERVQKCSLCGDSEFSIQSGFLCRMAWKCCSLRSCGGVCVKFVIVLCSVFDFWEWISWRSLDFIVFWVECVSMGWKAVILCALCKKSKIAKFYCCSLGNQSSHNFFCSFEWCVSSE